MRAARFIPLLPLLGWALACGDASAPPVAPAASEPSAAAAPAPAPAPSPSPAEPARPPAPRRALWVLCEGAQRVLEHPDRLGTLLADARALGATDLFVQVYRGGRAWFPSSLADTAPYERALAAYGGADPLATLIARAHETGLRVHAWVNVLSLAGNRDAPILGALGPEIVHADRQGRSMLESPDLEIPAPARRWVRMGTPAVWLDPGAPGVRERLVATFDELLALYPRLDGLHLDYIRYPDVLPFSPGARFRVGVDFGYGLATRARFEAETGRRAPFGEAAGAANAWDDWRRDQVTAIVRDLRAATRAEERDLELSAAVTAYPERAYLSLFQDWRGWLEQELLDFAVAMLYSRDDRLLRYESAAYVGGVGGERVWIGLGAWLFAHEPSRARAQLDHVGGLAPAGVALFSWDSIALAPALRDALAAPDTP